MPEYDRGRRDQKRSPRSRFVLCVGRSSCRDSKEGRGAARFKACSGGQRFSARGVAKRQHSTLRRLRGRVRTVTGREPFISPERRLRVLRQRVALAIGAAFTCFSKSRTGKNPSAEVHQSARHWTGWGVSFQDAEICKVRRLVVLD